MSVGHQNYDTPKTGEPKVSWSASGVMVSGDHSQTVSLQAIFRKPGTYTASFSLNPIDDVVVEGSDIRAEATVEWSVDGNTITRVISVSNGTSIQGTGEGVRIVVNDVTVIAGTISRYAVTIDVAPGPRGAFNTPPILNRQTEIVGLAPGFSATVLMFVPSS